VIKIITSVNTMKRLIARQLYGKMNLNIFTAECCVAPSLIICDLRHYIRNLEYVLAKSWEDIFSII